MNYNNSQASNQNQTYAQNYNQNSNKQSSVQKTMNATIKTGTYQNRNGEQKNSYLTIGKLFIYSNGGMSLKLDALPMNGETINFYDIKPKNQNQQNNNNNGGYQQR